MYETLNIDANSCYTDRIVMRKGNYVVRRVCWTKNLEVDGCPSKEILFGESALLMNAMYIVFSKGDL